MAILRHIRRTIYGLKRRYGEVAIVYRPASNTHNLETGEVTKLYERYRIRKVIVAPLTFDRSFIYDLTFIASNKNFTYGGFFDREQKVLVIDRRDLAIELTKTCRIVVDNKMYEIKTIEEAEHRQAYLVRVVRLVSKETIGVSNILWLLSSDLTFTTETDQV